MANQLSITPRGELEKDEVALSFHSSNISSHHDLRPQTVGEADRDDIEAIPIRADEPHNESCTTKRILSRISTKSSYRDPGPPPDGGLVAWTQVIMSHLVIMNTWGFINSYGVFQTYYVTFLNRSPADIAWVGSFQIFLLFFIGTFTGRLTDAGYFREIFLLGSFLQLLGIFMTSLSTQYWQLFLAQGVCVGLGNGCIFTPTISLISTYFSKKRALALGIGACGSATGGLVYPVMIQQLLPKIGFGWTMRSLGFVELAGLAVAISFFKTRLPPRRAGPIVEWAAFKEVEYTLFALGMFFNFWAVYFAFFYLGSFSRYIIDISLQESINLLLVLNGVGTIGRLLPNWLSDKYFGPLNVIIPVTLSCSIISYCMIVVDSRAGLYVWAIAYGTFAAGIQSLFPAVASSLTTDLSKSGVRLGMIFTIVSFAVLTGPPIQGLLITKDGGRYTYAQLFPATSLVIGCALMTGARFAKGGKVFKMSLWR